VQIGERIEGLIDAFGPADSPPPQQLWPFMSWCLSGAWPALGLATFFSAAAGAMEAGTALILGHVIDATVASGQDGFFDGQNVALIVAALAFFLLARPLLFGLSSASNSIIVGPNVNPLILSRLHRWTLGQSV
jgi:ATP-binding cassette subfamily B protein